MCAAVKIPAHNSRLLGPFLHCSTRKAGHVMLIFVLSSSNNEIEREFMAAIAPRNLYLFCGWDEFVSTERVKVGSSVIIGDAVLL